MPIEFDLNGVKRVVESPPDTPLLWVLRDDLEMTGTKYGCGAALCGACTVHVDGEAVRACSFPIRYAQGRQVRTIENIEDDAIGRAIVEAWIEHDVVQCGWCQPGQCMTAAALLAENATPSDDDIDRAMSANLCRCGTYPRIRKAVHTAAKKLNGGQEDGR